MPQLTLQGALAALKAAAQASVGDVVEPDELTRRANICLKGGTGGLPCPKRKIIRSKLSFSGVARRVLFFANKHRVPKELADYRCSVCRCPLLGLVPSKEPHRDNLKEAAARPGYCWVPGAVAARDAVPAPEPNEEPRSF